MKARGISYSPSCAFTALTPFINHSTIQRSGAEVTLPPEYLQAQEDLKTMMNLTSQFMMLTVLRTIREDPTTRQAISAGYKVPVLQGLREHYKDSVLDASLESLGFFSVAEPPAGVKGKKSRKRGASAQSLAASESPAVNIPSTSTAKLPESYKDMSERDEAITQRFGPHSTAYHEAREDLEKMLALNRQFFMITTHRMIYDHPKYREILALKALQAETQKDVERLQEANRKIKALIIEATNAPADQPSLPLPDLKQKKLKSPP